MRGTVRRYAERDRQAVLDLAPRLTEGVAPWRSPAAVRAAVTGWVVEALERADEPDRFVYVAELAGAVVGFVSGEQRSHWSGTSELYVGELVVSPQHEGQGVGRALLGAVTAEAARLGLASITLDTGAANAQARAFYRAVGFAEEDVKLTKVLGGMIEG
ncbi:GNAT family N-acetyltransferase [Kribbella antibiotica]|uniref:GNAT family N-acetyltransferase n=1 Tax=Kribbella antibiotica TaxID=190195 RepID=A0A4R4Z3A3_9ACTN|nr:GNAT family N-acetyltransferase [Kribbella antibiotica]TDD52413.1 GNAT family N-acetyltransferase [Kribbella antibiotica]